MRTSGLVKWGKTTTAAVQEAVEFLQRQIGHRALCPDLLLVLRRPDDLFLTAFAIRFNVFDGTLGRTLVGNLAFIGFGQIPGGEILFWAYQILAVALLAAASMTAFQDLQATAWRDVAIGEIPEIVVYRNPRAPLPARSRSLSSLPY